MVEIVFVGSIFAGFSLFISGWTGDLADRYNNKALVFASAIILALGYYLASLSTVLWQLYLTQGIIVGFGYSLGVTTITPVICHWFNKRRGLANGVTELAGGLGTVVTTLVTGSLLDLFGWQRTLKILALINLLVFSVASVLLVRRVPLVSKTANRSSVKESHIEPSMIQMQVSDNQDFNDSQIISSHERADVTESIVEPTVANNNELEGSEEKTTILNSNNEISDADESCYQASKVYFSDTKFLLVFSSFLLFDFGLCIPYIYLPLYAQELGYSISLSNHLLLLIGVGATLGTVVISVMADYYSCLLLVRVDMLVAGVITLVWLGFDRILGLYFYAVIFGVFGGSVLAVIPEICTELYSLDRLGAVLGIIYSSLSFGDFFASPIGAAMVRYGGGYPTVISVAGVFMILASILMDLACDSSMSVVNRTTSAISHYSAKSQFPSFGMSGRQSSLRSMKSIRSLPVVVRVASHREPFPSASAVTQGAGGSRDSGGEQAACVCPPPETRHVHVSLIKSTSTYLFGRQST